MKLNINIFLKLIFIIGFILFFASFLGKYFWFFDILNHFRLQALIAFIITLLFFIITKNKVFIVLNIFPIVIILFSFIPFYLSIDKVNNNHHHLKIYYANVLTSNENYTALIKSVQKENPDIIGLIEINQRWNDEVINYFRNSYPYSHSIPHEHNFGLMILSKYPIINTQIYAFSVYKLESILTTILMQNETINVLLTHTIPPIYDYNFIQRNNHLKALSTVINGKKNMIVIGDFNCSSFSPNFKNVFVGNQLKDSRLGFGLQTTWPTWARCFSTTLDHILIDKSMNVKQRKILDDIGSDHLPISIDIEL
jgi:endonuclease/exonuclease/phosphatase (EEP) superfamily protein YafD